MPEFLAHTDTGAPTISQSTPGNLIAFLDAVLVNGYGSKSPLGWTKAFSGTNVAIYQPGSGNNFYVRVDDTNPDSGYHARVTIHQTASGIDSYSTPGYPALSSQEGSLVYPDPDFWHVIGDDRTVYILSREGPWRSTSVILPQMFGAFDSISDDDQNNAALFPMRYNTSTDINNSTLTLDNSNDQNEYGVVVGPLGSGGTPLNANSSARKGIATASYATDYRWQGVSKRIDVLARPIIVDGNPRRARGFHRGFRTAADVGSKQPSFPLGTQVSGTDGKTYRAYPGRIKPSNEDEPIQFFFDEGAW